jgi:hypothetical protein
MIWRYAHKLKPLTTKFINKTLDGKTFGEACSNFLANNLSLASKLEKDWKMIWEKNQVEERVVVTILREKGEQGSLENLERER